MTVGAIATLFLTLARVLLSPNIVWMEAHSRRCLSLPSISRPLLCLRGDRSSTYYCNLASFGIGLDGHDFNNASWIHTCWNGHSLLLDNHRRCLHLYQTLLPNERQKLGPLCSLHGWSLPRPHFLRLHVGQHSCLVPWINKCATLLDHLYHRCNLRSCGIAINRLGRDCCKELCQPRLQCSHSNNQGST